MSVTVKNLENGAVWQKNVTSEQCERIERGYLEGKKTIPFEVGLIIPVRTNNLSNFFKDFFIPSTINQSTRKIELFHSSNPFEQKIIDAALRATAIFIFLFCDIITFPIRLFTCVPRILYNANQEETLLQKYLINQKVDPKVLSSDYVRIKLEYFDTHFNKNHWYERNVHFIEFPSYENENYFDNGWKDCL